MDANAPIAGALIVALGVSAIAIGAASLIHGARARRWPFVIGQVIPANVDADARRRRRGVRRLSYRYEVGGRTYRSDHSQLAWFGDRRPSARLSRRGDAADMRVHSADALGVRIHVNPDDPSDNMLEQRRVPHAVVLLGHGIALTVLGFTLVVRP